MNLNEIREIIAQDAQEWLDKDERVPHYINDQSAEIGLVSPEKFLEVSQYRRLEEKLKEEEHKWQYSGEKIKTERIGIFEAIKKNPKLIIIGDPGYGKTTCLHYLTLKYIEQQHELTPIYIELKMYREVLNRLEGLIDHSFNRLDINPNRVDRNKLIYLLDGFNELTLDEQKELIVDIKRMHPRFKGSRWIITSRKVSPPRELGNWPICEILDLDEKQVKDYLSAVLVNKNKSEEVWREINRKHLLNIAKVPMHLSLICKLAQRDRVLPKSKGELLKDVVCECYLSQDFIDKVNPNININNYLKYTALLAHEVFAKTGKITFDENFLRFFSEKNISKKYEQIVEDFEKLRLIEKHKVRENNKTINIYSFIHQSFFEFFIGEHLQYLFYEAYQTSADKLLEVALPYFEFIKWDEPVKIALALCEQNLANDIFLITIKQDVFLALTYFSRIENLLTKETKQYLDKIIKNRLKTKTWHLSGKKALIEAMGESHCAYFATFLMGMLKNDSVYIEAKTTLEKFGKNITMSQLTEFLQDKSNEVRFIAASLLGQVGNYNSIKFLSKLLKDTDSEVRWSALRALEKIGGTDSAKQIINFIKTESGEKIYSAIDSLGGIGDPIAIKPLVKLLKDEDKIVRYRVIEALGEIRNKAAIKPLIDLLNDKDHIVQYMTSSSLAKISNVYGVESLVKLLRLDHNEVNKYTIREFGNIGCKKSITTLIELLKKESLVQDIIYALGQTGDNAAIKPLIALSNNKKVSIRCAVARALGYIESKASVKLLIALIFDKDMNVGFFAADALGRIGDITATKLLIKNLKNKGKKVNSCAIKALCILNDPIGIEMVASFVNNKMLRFSIAENLRYSSGPIAINILIDLLKDNDKDILAITNIVIKEIGDTTAVKPLIELLDHRIKEVQLRATSALVRVGDATIVAPLAKKLKDDNELFRYLIAVALGRKGDSTAIDPLFQLLKDDKSIVRIYAAKALGEIHHRLREEVQLKKLIQKIRDLRKKANNNDLVFRMLIGWQQGAQRRGIWFVEEKKVKKQTETSAEITPTDYYIWSREGKGEIIIKSIDSYSTQISLLIDDDMGSVYSYGDRIIEFEKSNQNYKLLVCLLENRGRATPEQIFIAIFPDKRVPKNETIKKRIITPVYRLRDILKNYDYSLSPFRGWAYHLDSPVGFVMVRRK